MKKRFLVLCVLGSLAFLGLSCIPGRSHAQAGAPAPASPAVPTAWFNIEGDAANPAVNTIEVDPSPISVSGPVRTLHVRVSRSTERTSWDGVRYRSYVSQVVFNCTDGTARYAALSFYLQPGWKGVPYRTVRYSETEPRAMEFRDVAPNPTQRIIRAACQSASVTN